MKIVAKCIDFVSVSYQVQVKVCKPIPLSWIFRMTTISEAIVLFMQ